MDVGFRTNFDMLLVKCSMKSNLNQHNQWRSYSPLNMLIKAWLKVECNNDPIKNIFH